MQLPQHTGRGLYCGIQCRAGVAKVSIGNAFDSRIAAKIHKHKDMTNSVYNTLV
jgi:hypothetical protein